MRETRFVPWTEKAPAADGQRKLAERGEKLEFSPSALHCCRAERFLVAWPTSGDLFICAKDLFVAAMDGKMPQPLTAGASYKRAD